MIDLHVHSNYSDGTMSPKELVDYAVKKGLKAMALTDHDCIDGIDEAIEYANELREKGIDAPRIIPGIEFSTELNKKDIHIVGLFVDYKNKEFCDYLRNFVAERDSRNIRMCIKFTEAGMPMSYDELKAEYPDSVITRAHFASMLVKKGYVKSKQEAFDRYIGDGKPFHLSRERVLPQKAIELTLQAGGIPVLAHPILYGFSRSSLDSVVGSLKECGLMGIEAVYSTYSASDERQVRELAKKYHLLLSGGSDFHGSNKDNIDLATGLGHLHVHDELLEKIEASRKNILFTDMDGTLLLNDSTISDEMYEALKRVTQAGHRIVLTSGRPLDSILEVKDKFRLNFNNMFVVANNGSVIWDCQKEKFLHEIKLSAELMDKVICLCKEAGIHFHCYSEHEIVGDVEDDELAFYRKKIHLPFKLVSDVCHYLKTGTYKVEIISLDNHQGLVNLKAKILEEIGDRVEAVFSNAMYLEILPKGVSKGNALLFLEKYIPVAHSSTYASGDADNDLSMIEAAGTGVAMRNASDNVKAAADFVTELDNDNNGLIEVFEKFWLI